MKRHNPIHAGLFAGTLLLAAGASAEPITSITLVPAAQIETEGAAEIVAYDAHSQKLFVVNGTSGSIDVLSLKNPAAPEKLTTIDLIPFGAGANSVAAHDGVVAVAVEAENAQDPGQALFFDADDGRLLSQVTVGALPDMLTFTPDGTKLLVANEGEPKDYCHCGLAEDPEGSVSIVDLSGDVLGVTQQDVTTVDFNRFDEGTPPGVRVFGRCASVAQDLEPEYIAIAADSSAAWVTLQENNALAVIDLASAEVRALVPLGSKDHSQAGNALDTSNADGGTRILTWPIRGLYQPDAIAAYRFEGETYLITANEGDARDYKCFSEETRVAALKLDTRAFPDAERLQRPEELGRLKATKTAGDADGDGDHDTIYSFGSRSFSIWSANGRQVYDSGDDFAYIIAAAAPTLFNSEGPGTDRDDRSDDKGPEPEGVALGHIGGRIYAFIGLERTGGVMVYDVTNPRRPFFVQYAVNLTPGGKPMVGTKHDRAPEGLLFIPAGDAPGNQPLLVAAHEESRTVTLFRIEPRPVR